MARLGELERAVMDVLWNTPEPIPATHIVDVLPREHAPAVTTILTVLDRLGAKGFVSRVRHGRAYRYSATTTKAELIANTMLEALGTTSDRRSALVHFAGAVSEEEKAVLRELLASG
jgi:predicted transcriptional regulator